MKKFDNYDIYFNLISESLNIKIDSEYKFHDKRKWRFDYAIKENKIAIEIEGGLWVSGRHNRPITMIKDFEKYNEAAKKGWRILKYTPQQVKNLEMLKNDIIECIKLK